MPNKKKVLIIQATVPHYRIPIFNELAKTVDLTVVYDRGSVPDGANFATKKVDIINIKNKLWIHKKNMIRMAKKYDVVISMLDPSYLTTRLLCKLRKKTKLILWGIGVAASYGVRFDSLAETALSYMKMINQADAALFYSRYPVDKYSKMGVPESKLFVANNTVQVLPIEERERNSILFVGSLYRAKKIFELLECYKKAHSMCNTLPALVIVGDGEDAEPVKKWVEENHYEQQILLPGAIYDEKTLSEYFSDAIVCISPDQAGLSVLKSFGYGVPFVTHKDAITGGERLNIEDGINGVLFDSFDEITEIIKECADHPENYVEMGKNAKKYYDENRTVSHMVSGFIDAINFVTDKQTTEAGN